MRRLLPEIPFLPAIALLIGLNGCGPEPIDPAEPAGGDRDVLVPAAGSPATERRPFAAAGTQIVYVNFGGGTIRDCSNYCSDATTNRSWAIGAHWGRSSLTFAPYNGGSSARKLILSNLAQMYSGYDIKFTTSRPASGHYSMVIISTTSGGHHGVAPLDCGNKNPDDIAFVYKIGSSTAQWISQAAAHELGHSFGLAHVTSSKAIMQWASSGKSFQKSSYDMARAGTRCTSGSVQDAPTLLGKGLGYDYDGEFADDDGSVHESSIDKVAKAGITVGCSKGPPPKFCPKRSVTRGEMAVFLTRALKLPAASGDYFDDDKGQFYESAANRMYEKKITVGCGTRKYCGRRAVTRGEMAVFLTRALKLPAASGDYFDDDKGQFYESAANRMYERKITVGCGTRKYCGQRAVTRAEMATFLTRALKL